jgi:hypothetical protein
MKSLVMAKAKICNLDRMVEGVGFDMMAMMLHRLIFLGGNDFLNQILKFFIFSQDITYFLQK